MVVDGEKLKILYHNTRGTTRQSSVQFSPWFTSMAYHMKSDTVKYTYMYLRRPGVEDCLVMKEIRNKQDSWKLQEDINRLAKLESKWLMRFHHQKCKVLTTPTPRRFALHIYTLNGHTLECADYSYPKNLGLIFSSDPTWNIHNRQNYANVMYWPLYSNTRSTMDATVCYTLPY